MDKKKFEVTFTRIKGKKIEKGNSKSFTFLGIPGETGDSIDSIKKENFGIGQSIFWCLTGLKKVDLNKNRQ